MAAQITVKPCKINPLVFVCMIMMSSRYKGEQNKVDILMWTLSLTGLSSGYHIDT